MVKENNNNGEGGRERKEESAAGFAHSIHTLRPETRGARDKGGYGRGSTCRATKSAAESYLYSAHPATPNGAVIRGQNTAQPQSCASQGVPARGCTHDHKSPRATYLETGHGFRRNAQLDTSDHEMQQQNIAEQCAANSGRNNSTNVNAQQILFSPKSTILNHSIFYNDPVVIKLRASTNNHNQ
jgi:hypothetical protein